ncbi:hypothetical protein ACFU5O_12940 [Streptomyces sp. NPDC057445]|uniref:hypothetical protein n=1 Tax=Streptomyces sp. NPDC057445 TaxID=3346136 RepID=UPI0036777E03
MKAVADSAGGKWLAGALDSPVVGMAPWIIFSILAGPGRFGLAVGLALAVSVVMVVAGRILHPGTSLKILEVADVVVFTALAIVGALADEGTHVWLETYADEVANIALVLIAFGSMAVLVPFTLQYAHERVDPVLWDSPAFKRTNYVITGVWGLAFLAAAVTGGYGDLVLHNPDNIWTEWIIQILAIIAALRFTEWYPDYARAKARGEPTPPISGLLLPLAGLLIPIGVAVLIFEDSTWLGIALIVAGVLATKALRDDSKQEPATRSPE